MSKNFQSQSDFHKVLILPFKWWFSHAEVVARSECLSVLIVVRSQFAFIINFHFLGLVVVHNNATLESWVQLYLA